MKTFILLTILAIANADIQFSRTVNTIGKATGKVTLDSGCTSSDQYGSNDCDLHWGEKHTVTLDVALQEDLNSGSKFSLKATVLGIIPFDLSCPMCGANCTATIPVVNKKISIAMPACPIAKGSINKAFTFTLPATSPIPLSASVKGDVTVTDDSGATLVDLSLTAALSPSAAQLALAPKLRGPDSTIKACGCTCQCSGFLCGEASKAKSLCSEATQHGITNGEACSKAQGTLNSLAHGLAKLSSCTGTFNTGGGASVMSLSKAWLKSAGAPDTSHYEDPSAGGCQAGEEGVRIQGVQGDFCSPSCASGPCPTDVPAGTTAQPECCLETPGSSKPSRCALICQASSKCPAKASCKMVQGAIGLCTYNS